MGTLRKNHAPIHSGPARQMYGKLKLFIDNKLNECNADASLLEDKDIEEVARACAVIRKIDANAKHGSKPPVP